jgi:ribosomal protein L22
MADDEQLEETGVEETPAAEEKPTPKRASRKKAEPKAAAAETTADEAAVEEPEAETAAEPVAEAEAPAVSAPAPKARRAAAEPDAAPPVVRAQAKYVRTSARKARLVCDHIRGKSVDEARAILAFTPRAVAKDWTKLLNSAVANAEHNHELLGDDLKIVAAYADEGPTLKRFQPRAMGRATRIRKRTSHLTITLTPKG